MRGRSQYSSVSFEEYYENERLCVFNILMNINHWLQIRTGARDSSNTRDCCYLGFRLDLLERKYYGLCRVY
jgi:hypothetical protein